MAGNKAQYLSGPADKKYFAAGRAQELRPIHATMASAHAPGVSPSAKFDIDLTGAVSDIAGNIRLRALAEIHPAFSVVNV